MSSTELSTPKNIDIIKYFKESKNHKIITEKYPEIKADLYSFSVNPNCSCRKKIFNFINKNEKEIIELMKDNPIEESQKEESQKEEQDKKMKKSGSNLYQAVSLEPSKNIVKYNDSAGKTILIKREEYSDFITKIRREHWAFKGISVFPVGENLELFFY